MDVQIIAVFVGEGIGFDLFYALFNLCQSDEFIQLLFAFPDF